MIQKIVVEEWMVRLFQNQNKKQEKKRWATAERLQ